jgi:predicted HAD superfamily Cof-like phosphohydrolase
MQYLIDVAAFHQKFDVPSPPEVALVPSHLMDFRIGFMTEELEEFKVAYALGDLEGELDALVDLVYVALGTALTRGFDFNEAWRRVHEANMKKIAVQYSGQDGRHSTDVVKPEGWTPPDLSDLAILGRYRDHP